MTSSTAQLNDLCDRLLARNPFTDNRVNAPSEDAVDVPSLNGTAFERLTGLAREALAARRGIGAMLWGEAGVGKSHLLGRLDRWARGEGNGCSIYLHNLQASPANLPRTLLRHVLDSLTWSENEQPGHTVLFTMIHQAARRALGDSYVTWSQVRQGLLSQLAQDGPADAALADQTVIDILFRLYRSIHLKSQGRDDGATARAALRWLRGDAITSPEAMLLGLPPSRRPELPLAIEDSQQLKQVLAIMTRLAAACERPFLLLFDQIDNLEPEQASALSRFLEALIDSSRNLLVVTAGIQATLTGWRQQRVFQDSAWDRLAQVQVQLLRLSPVQARQLIEKRLSVFFEAAADLPPVHRLTFEDALFPLGKRWFDKTLGAQLEVRPREAISQAGEAWYREQQWLRQQSPEQWLAGWKQRTLTDEGLVVPLRLEPAELNDLIDRAILHTMTQHAAARRGTPPDCESLTDVLTELLEEQRRCDATSALTARQRADDPYDLWLTHRDSSGAEWTTGVVLAAGLNARQLAPLLGKLVEDKAPPRRVLLVSGEAGLVLGDKGLEYQNALQSRPNTVFEVVPATSVELITLDALHAAWNLARSEDLSVTLSNGQKRLVTPEEVIASHQRQGQFAASNVLRTALTCSPPRASFPALELGEAQLEPTEAMPVLAEPTEDVSEEALFADPVSDVEEFAEVVGEAEEVLDLTEETPVLTEEVDEAVVAESIDDILFAEDVPEAEKI